MLRAILNISLRAKIMLVLFAVSLSVMAVATYDSYDAHRAKSRGQFLRKHYERFDAYRKGAGGALKRIAAVGTPRSFRAISELGFSGRILPLAAMAIGGGGGNAIATAYERMGVPDVLRDGVTQALGAPPVLLRERQSVVGRIDHEETSAQEWKFSL